MVTINCFAKKWGIGIIAVCMIIGIVVVMLLKKPSELSENRQQLIECVSKWDSSSDEVFFNEFIPFDWDNVYSFYPYTSCERMEEIIGFKSDELIENSNENLNHLVFTKDNRVVCVINDYPSEVGFSFSFGTFQEYVKINKTDNQKFHIEIKDGIRLYSIIKER